MDLHYKWGVEPAKLHQHLHQMDPKKAAEFLLAQTAFLDNISEVKNLIGSDRFPVISNHDDELVNRE